MAQKINTRSLSPFLSQLVFFTHPPPPPPLFSSQETDQAEQSGNDERLVSHNFRHSDSDHIQGLQGADTCNVSCCRAGHGRLLCNARGGHGVKGKQVHVLCVSPLFVPPATETPMIGNPSKETNDDPRTKAERPTSEEFDARCAVARPSRLSAPPN